MFFVGLILMILILDLGIKDVIEETKETDFPKELEGTRGKIMSASKSQCRFSLWGIFQKAGDGERSAIGDHIRSGWHFPLAAFEKRTSDRKVRIGSGAWRRTQQSV